MPLPPLLFAGMNFPANQKKTPIKQPPQFASSANITARKPLTHDSVSFSNTHNQPHFGADAPLPPPGGGGWDPFSQWASEPIDDPYDNSGWNPLLGTHGQFMPQEEDSGAVLSKPSTQNTGKKKAKDLSPRALRYRAERADKEGRTDLANELREMARAKQTPQLKTPKRPDELSPSGLRKKAAKATKEGKTDLANELREMARAKQTPQLKTPKRPDGLSPSALRRRAAKADKEGRTDLANEFREMARAKQTPQLKPPKRPDELSPSALRDRAAKADKEGRTDLANEFREMARAKERAGAHSQLGSGVSESEQGGYSSTGLTGHLTGLQVQQPLNMQQLLSNFREMGQVDTNIPQNIHQAVIGRLYQQAAKQTDATKQQKNLGFSNEYQRAVEDAFPLATWRFKRLLGNLDEINSQPQDQQVASPESTGSGHETEDEQWSTQYQHLEWFKRNGRYHDKDGNPV